MCIRDSDTIERGIKKAAGADSADNYEKAVYEGYGPNGVAIIVETLTDNKNRTAGNVRNAFTKGNGSIGTQGCVSYMFDQKGQIIIDKEECEMDADELMMLALDAGAEDFSEEEDSYEILTAPDDFSAVREALEKAGLPIAEAQVAMIPQTYVELTDEQALKDLQRTLDLLDDDELALMKQMRPGLIQLEIGVQTTNLMVVKEIRRTMDLDKVARRVAQVNTFGNIHQHLDLIAGLPYEDIESFHRSFNDVYKMEPEQLQLGFLKVLKGSYMEEMKQKYGLLSQSKPPYEVLRTNWLSYEEVIRLKGVEEMVEVYYNLSLIHI